jgi:hypothetical protein
MPSDERLSVRTAKSCGPGLPVLRPCDNAFHALRKGAIKPVPKESAYKP